MSTASSGSLDNGGTCGCRTNYMAVAVCLPVKLGARDHHALFHSTTITIMQLPADQHTALTKTSHHLYSCILRTRAWHVYLSTYAHKYTLYRRRIC